MSLSRYSISRVGVEFQFGSYFLNQHLAELPIILHNIMTYVEARDTSLVIDSPKAFRGLGATISQVYGERQPAPASAHSPGPVKL